MRRPPFALLLALAVTAGACSTMYYAAMSQLGWAKADLLANRIQLSRDAMDQARIQLAEALPLFAEAPAADDRSALRAAYDDSAASAAALAPHRAAVAKAASALFAEWRHELDAASDEAQRAKRQERYDTFRRSYDRLLDAMRDAEAALPPVLDAMQAAVAAPPTAPAPPIDPAAGDRLLRNLQFAVALADQYVAGLETLD